MIRFNSSGFRPFDVDLKALAAPEQVTPDLEDYR